MKRLSLASLSLLLPLTMNAQIVRGDMDGNGTLTIADVTLLASKVVGCTAPETITAADLVDNRLLAGTWYKTKADFITFTAEGTTTYASTGLAQYPAATHFKFFPDLKYIILTDEDGYAMGVLNVVSLDDESIVIDGTTYTRTAPVVNVVSIALNLTALQLFPKTSQQLETSVLPADADNQALVWTTSDPEVATVADGLVTAVAVGTATITCTAADGSGITTSCTVTVTPEGLPGTQVGEGSGA